MWGYSAGGLAIDVRPWPRAFKSPRGRHRLVAPATAGNYAPAIMAKDQTPGRRPFLVALTLAAGAVALVMAPLRGESRDWRTASREPTGIAPDPATTPEAVVQVYSARTFSWRGYFAVHTWIAVKPTDAVEFSIYEVIGFRLRSGNSALSVSNRPPDARWFGNEPEILADLRGEGVDDIIRRIDLAARRYPYSKQYAIWPGPNSNTFTAFVARAVPELRLDLPPTAVGKDYLGDRMTRAAPSGTGFQFNLGGYFGILAGREEGLEISILGLTFGIDPGDLAIKLPMIGKLSARPGNGRAPVRSLPGGGGAAGAATDLGVKR